MSAHAEESVSVWHLRWLRLERDRAALAGAGQLAL